MKRKGIIICVIVMLMFTGCASIEEKIEGYWLDDESEVLIFTGEDCTFQGEVWNYKIYDENRLQLTTSFLGIEHSIDYVVEFVDNEHLKLTEVGTDKECYFTKNEKEQKEIIERKEERERLEEDRRQEEQRRVEEQQEKERIREERERQFSIIESDIEYYQNQIGYYEDDIEEYKKKIVDLENDIEGYEYNVGTIELYEEIIGDRKIYIEECEIEIEQLKGKKEELVNMYYGKEEEYVVEDIEISDVDLNKVYSIAEKRIYPVYEKDIATELLGVVCEGAVKIKGEIYYAVCLNSDQGTHYSTIDRFAINPNNEEIYWFDYLEFVNGNYHLWNENNIYY